MKTSRQSTSRSRMVLLTLLAVPFIYPFLFLGFAAVKTPSDYNRDPLGLPHAMTTEHLRFAWDNANLGPALINSTISVGIAVVLVVVLSTCAGFWYLRHSGRGARALMTTLFVFWAVPFVVFAVPLYVALARLGLLNNLLVLGVVYAGMNLPFGIYLMHSYFRRGIPSEILEAAAVDGASVLRTLVSIVMPMGRPALGTLAALTFVWSWGDLLAATFLMQDTSKFTMTVAASTLVSRGDARVQSSAAAAVISLVPLFLVFLFAQRAISKGFSGGIGK